MILSDSKNELEDIQRLLRIDHGRVQGKTVREVDESVISLRLFDKQKPALLILAYDTVERAEQLYIYLYNLDEKFQKMPHQTLLLCRGNESDKAFKLCHEELIDDYVADRPLFDPHRLRLSVNQALERYELQRQIGNLKKQMGVLASGLNQFDSLVRNISSISEVQQKRVMEAVKSYSHRLNGSMQKLEKEMGEKITALKDPAALHARATLTQEVEKVRNEAIEPGNLELVGALKKQKKLQQKLHTEALKYASRTREVVEESEVEVRTVDLLLVDDDDFYRHSFAELLEESGLSVAQAEDGPAAIRTLINLKPKVILLDIQMPGINGITTLRQIRANPQTAGIPVLMLTGINSDEVVMQSRDAGAKGFILKPSSRETVLAKIAPFIKHTQET
ncbi:MAG: response regulator [Gammaproteobacteria bacterium]|nr:response regulator [Gammaproteobacteria bacterium]